MWYFVIKLKGYNNFIFRFVFYRSESNIEVCSLSVFIVVLFIVVKIGNKVNVYY